MAEIKENTEKVNPDVDGERVMPETQESPKRGRPTDYQPEYAEQAYKLCLLGAKDKELADFFHTSEQTLNAWKHAHPIFLESLKKAKDEFDTDIIENSLRKRAMGFRYQEVTQEVKPGMSVDIEGGEVSGVGAVDVPASKIVTKEVAPDTTACIFWLKNRQPARWRDKTEVEANVTGEIIFNENRGRQDEAATEDAE